MEYTIATYKDTMMNNKEICKGAGGILAIATVIGTQFANRVECYAANPTKILDPSNVDNFVNGVNNGSYSDKQFDGASKEISNVGGSSIRALRSVALIILMIAGIVGFIKIAGGSGQGQNDGKSGLVKVAMAVCILAALSGFAGLCFDIGSKLTME